MKLFLPILLLALLAQDEELKPKDYVKKLVEGAREEWETAANALVKNGKQAHKLLKRAHKKSGDDAVRKRIEKVILRIDAETDIKAGSLGDIKISIEEDAEFKIRYSEKIKESRLVIQVPLRLLNDGKESVDIILRKAIFYTYGKKTPLIVLGRGGKNRRYSVPDEGILDPTFISILNPKWEEGTLGVVVMKFEVDGKTLTLRTDVMSVEKGE